MSKLEKLIRSYEEKIKLTKTCMKDESFIESIVSLKKQLRTYNVFITELKSLRTSNLDLKKLSAQVDEALAKETPESIRKWHQKYIGESDQWGI